MKRKLFSNKSLIKTFLLLAIITFAFACCEVVVEVYLANGSIQGQVEVLEQCTADPGTKEVTCSDPGAVTISVYVGDEDATTRGTVLACMDVPADQETAGLYDGSCEVGVPAEATSAADGSFLLDSIPPGWYDILVSAEGKSSVWLRPIYLFSGLTVNVPPITLMDEVGANEFRLVLTWNTSDNLDLHVTLPDADDPCATLDTASDYYTYIGVGLGSCSYLADSEFFTNVQDTIYEYPARTAPSRIHIWPGAIELSYDYLGGTAVALNGDALEEGPEVLDFSTAYMPFGQYLVSVVNSDEADESESAYGLGESGATVILYGEDEVSGSVRTANPLLQLQVGNDMSGNIWRVLYIDNVFTDEAADPVNEVWAHPFNMFQYTFSGTPYSDFNTYFNFTGSGEWVRIQ